MMKRWSCLLIAVWMGWAAGFCHGADNPSGDGGNATAPAGAAEWTYCAWEMRDEGDTLVAEGQVSWDEHDRLDESNQKVHDSRFAGISDRRIEVVSHRDDSLEVNQYFPRDDGTETGPQMVRLHRIPGVNMFWMEVEQDGQWIESLVGLFTGSLANGLTGFGAASIDVEFGMTNYRKWYETTEEDGRVTRIELRDDAPLHEAMIPGKAEITYNDDGYFDRVITEDADGNVVDRFDYDYDAEGRLKRVKSRYDVFDKETMVTTYDYDCRAVQPGPSPEDEKSQEEAVDSWSTDGLEAPVAPVHSMFAAIAASDVEAFRAEFAPEVRASMDEYGPRKAMQAWSRGFVSDDGDSKIDPADLRYEFREKSSAVRVIHGGKELGSVEVGETEEGWKIVEK